MGGARKPTNVSKTADDDVESTGKKLSLNVFNQNKEELPEKRDRRVAEYKKDLGVS
jgi:hypothetical protein